MGTYKARQNNEDYDELESKSEKEQKKESTEKAVDLVGETALDAFTAGKGSQIKNMAEKVPVIGSAVKNTWDGAVKRVSKFASRTPVGDIAKAADDAGVTDMARTAKDVISMKNGPTKDVDQSRITKGLNTQAKGGKNNSSSSKSAMSSLFNTSSSSALTGNIIPGFAMKKKMLIALFAGGLICLVLFITVFAEQDVINLGVTNDTEMSNKVGNAANSAEVMANLQKLAEYFIENAGGYNMDTYLYVPFIDRNVRKDCTGFATAFMHMVSGNVPQSSTGEMIDINGNWANTIKEDGWVGYTVDEIGSVSNLRPGDVLVEHYSGTNRHAEIYVDATHTFGWGSQQTEYPLNKTIVDTSTGSNKSFGDGYHLMYTVVYRYEGGTIGNSSSISDIDFSDLNIIKDYSESFNHGSKPKSNQKYIMLHDTEMNVSAKNIVSSWKNSNCGGTVAAHFVIDKDGTVYQAADLDVITHHAGFGGPGNFDEKYGVGSNNRSGTNDDLVGQTCSSNYDGYTSYGMNSYSIGIEMVHVGGEDYPETQLNAVDKVIAYIDNYYGFASIIIDHKEWRPSNSDTDSKFSTYLNNYKTLRHH